MASSNLYFETKIEDLPEAEKLFKYIEAHQTSKFLTLARSSGIYFSELKNSKGQSLMHMTAMVGDSEIASFLVNHMCLGTNKDLSGYTATDLALQYNNLHIVDIISAAYHSR